MSVVTYQSQMAVTIEHIDRLLIARVDIAINYVKRVVTRTLSGPRSGRTYPVPGTGKYNKVKTGPYAGIRKRRVPGTGRYYLASAPGEAPASRLGDLRKHIRVKVVKRPDGVDGICGTPFNYGEFLEKGTPRMAARPWLRVSWKRATPTIKKIMTRG